LRAWHTQQGGKKSQITDRQDMPAEEFFHGSDGGGVRVCTWLGGHPGKRSGTRIGKGSDESCPPFSRTEIGQMLYERTSATDRSGWSDYLKEGDDGFQCPVG